MFLLGDQTLAQNAPKKDGGPPAKTAPLTSKPQPKQQTIAVPPPEVLLVLVRSALIALDQANKTGNYTVLRDLGAPSLQAHSSAQLGIAFANLRNQQVDLLPVAILTPQLKESPSISPEGLLKLSGHFPTKPRSIDFDVVYQAVGGQWKLFGLTVRLQAQPSSSPGAALPKAAAPPAQTKK